MFWSSNDPFSGSPDWGFRAFFVLIVLVGVVSIIVNVRAAFSDSWKEESCDSVCGAVFNFGVSPSVRRSRCDWCLERDRKKAAARAAQE